jgi:multimeric flavodoxin WrbA
VQPNVKHLLIVYHSKDGSTGKMAAAVWQGTQHEDVDIEVRMRQAREADIDDLLWADGLVLGTPENFGYMSGMMKDFLERTFYPAEGKVEGLPFGIFISASNDGTGALSSLRRIWPAHGGRDRIWYFLGSRHYPAFVSTHRAASTSHLPIHLDCF